MLVAVQGDRSDSQTAPGRPDRPQQAAHDNAAEGCLCRLGEGCDVQLASITVCSENLRHTRRPAASTSLGPYPHRRLPPLLGMIRYAGACH